MPEASATARTRFGIAGWGARRAGSFAGKFCNRTITFTVALAATVDVSGTLPAEQSMTGTLSSGKTFTGSTLVPCDE